MKIPKKNIATDQNVDLESTIPIDVEAVQKGHLPESTPESNEAEKDFQVKTNSHDEKSFEPVSQRQFRVVHQAHDTERK